MASYKSLFGLTLLFGAVNLLQAESYQKVHVPVKKSHPRDLVYPEQFTRLTLKSGAPVGDKFNSLTLGKYGPILLQDAALVEENAHFNRERIPERVVHARGAAAFGEFEVTDTLITKYCKAPLFATKGKKTPVAVRFSQAVGQSGSADTPRDIRGFAVKFYTELGNWDLVGFNIPVFFFRDPMNFPSFIHAVTRNPKSHLRDPETLWDFFVPRPESALALLYFFSDAGTPHDYRHMDGFPINTFKLVNAYGEQFYARFHFVSHQGIKNLTAEEATVLAGLNPDNHLQDLREAIDKGEHPSWTFKFQAVSLKDAAHASFNLLDSTKEWPVDKYPLYEIGTMTLNKNPTNYHSQVEQLAFSPNNLILGVEPTPDRILQARLFAYPDAQRYRLGANYFDLPVNRPRCPVMTPTYVDGLTFKKDFGNGTVPNYVPSSKFTNMKLLNKKFLLSEQAFAGHIGRFDLSDEDNFSQPKAFYQALDSGERQRLAQNIAFTLKLVPDKELVVKVVDYWRQVDTQLADDISVALAAVPMS